MLQWKRSFYLISSSFLIKKEGIHPSKRETEKVAPDYDVSKFRGSRSSISPGPPESKRRREREDRKFAMGCHATRGGGERDLSSTKVVFLSATVAGSSCEECPETRKRGLGRRKL